MTASKLEESIEAISVAFHFGGDLKAALRAFAEAVREPQESPIDPDFIPKSREPKECGYCKGPCVGGKPNDVSATHIVPVPLPFDTNGGGFVPCKYEITGVRKPAALPDEVVEKIEWLWEKATPSKNDIEDLARLCLRVGGKRLEEKRTK